MCVHWFKFLWVVAGGSYPHSRSFTPPQPPQYVQPNMFPQTRPGECYNYISDIPLPCLMQDLKVFIIQFHSHKDTLHISNTILPAFLSFSLMAVHMLVEVLHPGAISVVSHKVALVHPVEICSMLVS